MMATATGNKSLLPLCSPGAGLPRQPFTLRDIPRATLILEKHSNKTWKPLACLSSLNLLAAPLQQIVATNRGSTGFPGHKHKRFLNDYTQNYELHVGLRFVLFEKVEISPQQCRFVFTSHQMLWQQTEAPLDSLDTRAS